MSCFPLFLIPTSVAQHQKQGVVTKARFLNYLFSFSSRDWPYFATLQAVRANLEALCGRDFFFSDFAHLKQMMD